MNFLVIDRQTDGRMHLAMHMIPPCLSTGVIKNYNDFVFGHF